MKKRSNDGSCAKLLLKKSSGHLKISLAIFLASITITGIIGLLYARQYFQYEKDFLENVAMRTITVERYFGNQSVRSVSFTDVSELTRILDKEFPSTKTTVIPVYRPNTGFTVDESPINLFAVERSHSFLVDLDDMLDNTAYSISQQPKTIGLEISVITEITDNGFVSGVLERVILNTELGASRNTPILSTQNFFPSMLEYPTFFVNMDTFHEIASIFLNREIVSMQDATDSGLISLQGIFVYVDDLRLVSAVASFLMEQDYSAAAPADAFDNFGETLSVAFMVFLLSSICLICMTTVNIILSFRSFYRVQQKDMGVLRYMGFGNKRIYKMYRKNLGIKFLQIMGVSALLIFMAGMILFSFGHWFVLAAFILSLAAFLCLLFIAISRFIIYSYVRQELLVLIRESKEFE
ncbi:MAG: hypothetical protein LBQ33_00720 [Oscillospiraceae bacterium]|nr:hypothetical protein [Oscillospiraceae bacterium]